MRIAIHLLDMTIGGLPGSSGEKSPAEKMRELIQMEFASALKNPITQKRIDEIDARQWKINDKFYKTGIRNPKEEAES